MDTDPQEGVTPFDDLINSLGTEPEEVSQEAETEPEEVSEEPQEAPEEPEATEEPDIVEFDGKKLEIPKGTPPELVESVKSMAADLKADYTRKTQEVAEGRKFVQSRVEAIQQQEQMLSANFQKAVELKAVTDRIAQFEQLDWDSLATEDPAQATRLNVAYQKLQREAQTLRGQLQQQEAQRQQAIAQTKQEALQEAFKELQRRIPKWTADTGKQISEHAQKYGFTAEELSAISDPRMVEALHDAMQWRKLQAQKPQALKKVADAPRMAKPGPSLRQAPNKAAEERLKKHGRLEDLAALL